MIDAADDDETRASMRLVRWRGVKQMKETRANEKEREKSARRENRCVLHLNGSRWTDTDRPDSIEIERLTRHQSKVDGSCPLQVCRCAGVQVRGVSRGAGPRVCVPHQTRQCACACAATRHEMARLEGSMTRLDSTLAFGAFDRHHAKRRREPCSLPGESGRAPSPRTRPFQALGRQAAGGRRQAAGGQSGTAPRLA